jgi:diaminopimelate epimerase
MNCGTGAVASAYVAHRIGKTGDRVVVHTAGGCLRISLASDREAFMEGTAVRVYDGTVDLAR